MVVQSGHRSLFTKEDARLLHKGSVTLFTGLSVWILATGPLSAPTWLWCLWPLATWGSKLYAMNHFTIPNFKRYYWGRVTKENTWYTFHQYVYCTWFWVRFHPACPLWLCDLDLFTNSLVLLCTVIVTPWERFCTANSDTEWSRALRGQNNVDSDERGHEPRGGLGLGFSMESFITLSGLRVRTILMRVFELLCGMILCHMAFGTRDLDMPRSSALTQHLLWMSVYCTLTNHLQFFLGTITSKGYVSKQTSAWLYACLGQLGMMVGWSTIAVRALLYNQRHGTIWLGSAPFATVLLVGWLFSWIQWNPWSPWVRAGH